MSLLQSMNGMLCAEVTSADIPGFLAAVNGMGVSLLHIRTVDPLSVRISFYRSNWTAIQKLAQRRGEKIRIHKQYGIYWPVKRILNRPTLILGLAVIICLAVFLPTRILFIKVEGNDRIPTKLILEKAEMCGITFGASRRQVRSEQMKNNLLSAIPQLQWAGINTLGCTAVISVEERSGTVTNQKIFGVSSIVAARDGVIQSCTVTKGSALCKAGQAVKAGEVLVSGYTDCGIKIQATRAEAEIFAQTLRKLEVVTPVNYAAKGEVAAVDKKYSIIIGKKRINFYKDSGISDTTCDKMYQEHNLTLPGGFILPVTVVVEYLTWYNNETIEVVAESAQSSFADFVDRYLPGQMISGQILERKESSVQVQDVFCMQGEYVCLEMIGRVQYEEIVGNNGKND